MSDEKTCPFCAETIKTAAIKCKHCGEMLTENAPQVASGPAAPAPGESSDGTPDIRRILTFLLFLGGLGVFVMAMTMDTTVDSGFGRVANIHLGQQKQTYMMASGLAVFLGIVLGYLAQQSSSSPVSQSVRSASEVASQRSASSEPSPILKAISDGRNALNSSDQGVQGWVALGLAVVVAAIALYIMSIL